MPQLFSRSLGLSALPFLRPRVNPAEAQDPPDSATASRQLLRGCAATLNPFIRDSETALNSIGAVMADLFDGAVHIRGDAESTRDSITSLAHRANTQLHEIQSTLERSIHQLHASRTLLGTLDSRLAAIIRDFAALEAGVREFRVVGTLIRIEGSNRAADSDAFVNISERSAAITADLGELVGQIRTATAGLRLSFHTVSREINSLTATSLRTLTTLIADVSALEKIMTAEHHGISAAAEETFTGLDRIRNSLGELVYALQIHDILRQQSEHSLANIDDLLAHPSLTPADRQPGRAIVQAQITHTLSLCQEASVKVDTGLHAAAHQLTQIGHITQRVTGLTHANSPSRRAVQQSTTAILAALPVLEQGDVALEKALHDLLDGTGAILTVIAQVSHAMLNMRWLGLNATIQSANRPQPGSAIETLGARTATIVDAVDQECLQLRAALQQLRLDVESHSRAALGALGQSSVRQVAETSIALFDSVHHSIGAAMARQASLQQTLEGKLHHAQASLSCFRNTQAPPALAVARLAQDPSQSPLSLPVALSPPAAALFDSWVARYTMASERRVHATVLGLPFAEAENDAPAEGDIELF